jgi:hypothetical protein
MNEEKEKKGEDKNKDILSCMIDMQLGKSESTPELLRLRLLGVWDTWELSAIFFQRQDNKIKNTLKSFCHMAMTITR